MSFGANFEKKKKRRAFPRFELATPSRKSHHRIDCERSMKICLCRPAQLTYQPKLKRWDTFGSFWLIKLKVVMQVPFMCPHATVTFGNNPTIFLPTNPTYQKVAYSKIFNLPQLEHFLQELDETWQVDTNEKTIHIKPVPMVRPAKFPSYRNL